MELLKKKRCLLYRTLKKIIEAAGGSIEDIVKCTVHLSDINDFEKYNAAYASFFPGIKPARTTVQSVIV